MQSPILPFAATVLALGLLPAQAPITAPRLFHGTAGPSASLGPLGRTFLFEQIWYCGDAFPAPLTIREIGWRGDPSANVGPQTIRFEITLDSSPKPMSGLSRRFATNLSGQESRFFSMKAMSLPAVNRPTDLNRPTVWIPGDAPFAFTGPHLLVQVDVQTSFPPLNTGHDLDAFVQLTPSYHVESTGSCLGASLRSSWTGGIYSLDLRGAPANAVAGLLLGVDNLQAFGVPLPWDLGVLGMPGCNLLVEPAVTAVVMTDDTGAATASVPLGMAASSAIFAQALIYEPTQPRGGTSTLASALIGHQGTCTYLYNWERFAPDAEFGPYAMNCAPILLVR